MEPKILTMTIVHCWCFCDICAGIYLGGCVFFDMHLLLLDIYRFIQALFCDDESCWNVSLLVRDLCWCHVIRRERENWAL